MSESRPEEDFTIKIDLRLHEVEYELWALDEFLTGLRFAEERAVAACNERLDGLRDLDEAEQYLAFQEVNEVQQNIIPRYFSNAAVIGLYSCLEYGLKEIVSLLNQQGHLLESAKQGGGSHFQRYRTHLEATIDTAAFKDVEKMRVIDDLRNIRNWLIHSLGQLDGTGEERIRTILHRYPSIQEATSVSRHIIGSEFLRQSQVAVSEILRQLIFDAKARLNQDLDR